MRELLIRNCLKCNSEFRTYEKDRYYCPDCKWDMEHGEIDFENLSNKEPKLVVNKFGEFEAIENIEGEKEMAKKTIINTVKPKSDMGKVIAGIEKEAFGNAENNAVVKRLEEKIDSISFAIDELNGSILKNQTLIDKYEQENQEYLKEIELHQKQLKILREIYGGSEVEENEAED